MARMAVIVLILGICLPDVLPARMVLKAGEIDSGKVRVGAFAEVVYGKGKRDPVSGDWEKLARVSGYIKAVDAESLTLALRQGLGKKRIAFAHIQKLLLAKSSREVGRLKAESSGMVLKAGEIDSGKVRVGVFAAVVYGKGKRDPVSGDWEKLVTASGYIKAVDAESLTLVLSEGLGKKRIAFARIQKLLLSKSSRDMARLRKTTDMELPFARTDVGSWRSEGRRIRIHTRGLEEEIVARVHRVTRDTLFFKRRIREKRPASIAITDISGLEVYKYRGSHAKEGAIVGAVTGLILPFIVFSGYLDDGEPGELDPESLKALTAIMFFSPTLCFVGGMGGAFVGGMFGYDVWQTVDHLSPSTVERRRGLSYRLSFRF